nr:unnamed protein product [Haemonchus contortus]
MDRPVKPSPTVFAYFQDIMDIEEADSAIFLSMVLNSTTKLEKQVMESVDGLFAEDIISEETMSVEPCLLAFLVLVMA